MIHTILSQAAGIGPIPLDIALHHHERRDGNGHPERIGASQISEFAKMAAIVDVYDAITSERCYHKAIGPSEALAKMVEWSETQFDPVLIRTFVRLLGIYPVGTLVRLESGRLGVVAEGHETNLLTPKINVFFSTKSGTHIRPQTVDLARGLGFGGADRIVSAESPERWRVDPLRFLTLS